MTTNDPESLDPALLRPGRVDLKIHFGYAERIHAEEMFVRFFGSGSLLSSIRPTLSTAILEGKKPFATDEKEEKVTSVGDEDSLKAENENKERLGREIGRNIMELARTFASLIPPKTLTPAEIQGYLLLKSGGSATEALKGTQRWIEETLRTKREGINVSREEQELARDGN